MDDGVPCRNLVLWTHFTKYKLLGLKSGCDQVLIFCFSVPCSVEYSDVSEELPPSSGSVSLVYVM